MSSSDLDRTDPGRLARILRLAEGDIAAVDVGADELGAILRHQLAMRMDYELPHEAGGRGGIVQGMVGDDRGGA